MARTVIRKLVAHDEAARADVVIEPGVCIASYAIRRLPDEYAMEFVVRERRLRCALAEFQARTEMAVMTADERTLPEDAALV